MIRDFAGHAKATDKDVSAKVPTLTTKLLDARAAIERTILENGDLSTEKADDDSGDVATLSSKQYLALQAAIDAMDTAAYADAIYDDAQLLVEIGWNAAKKLLSIETGFDVVPTWALKKIQTAGEAIAQKLVDRDKTTLKTVLSDAFINGSSAKDTSKALRAAFSNGITIYDENGAVQSVQKSDAWFDMVARTELQRAAVQGQMALYDAAEIQTVRWQAAEPCDICEEYDGKVFDLSDPDLPEIPQHPNCRCVWSPADADLGDHRGTEEDRANARQGNQRRGES